MAYKNEKWDGNKIGALRRHLHLNQTDFAERLGTNQYTVSCWERGIHQPTRITQVLFSFVAERAGFFELYPPNR